MQGGVALVVALLVLASCGSGSPANSGDQEADNGHWGPQVCEDWCPDTCLLLDQCLRNGYVDPALVELCSLDCRRVPHGFKKRLLSCGAETNCDDFSACIEGGGDSQFDCVWQTDNIDDGNGDGDIPDGDPLDADEESADEQPETDGDEPEDDDEAEDDEEYDGTDGEPEIAEESEDAEDTDTDGDFSEDDVAEDDGAAEDGDRIEDDAAPADGDEEAFETETEAESETEIDESSTCEDFVLSCDNIVSHNTELDGSARITNYPYCQGMETGPEVIYSFTSPDDCLIRAIVSGQSADLDLFLLGECDRMTCADFSATTGAESLEFYMTARDTHYLVVDGFQGAAGDYTISLECDCGTVPDGDEEKENDVEPESDTATDGDATDGDAAPDEDPEEAEADEAEPPVDGDEDEAAEIEEEAAEIEEELDEPEADEPEIDAQEDEPEIDEQEADESACSGPCAPATAADYCVDTLGLCSCNAGTNAWMTLDCETLCVNGGYDGATRCGDDPNGPDDVCYCYDGECWTDEDCVAQGSDFCLYDESTDRTFCQTGECASDFDCQPLGKDWCVMDGDATVCLEDCPIATCDPYVGCIDFGDQGLCADDLALPCIEIGPIPICFGENQTPVDVGGDCYCWDECLPEPNTCSGGRMCTPIVDSAGRVLHGGCT
ncbi:MAG: hypothetical protein C4523_11780 [Myxococcales bacterium]|nr:MAG: hypothetical protein C4523_11780 [Myxococcales bacterium]